MPNPDRRWPATRLAAAAAAVALALLLPGVGGAAARPYAERLPAELLRWETVAASPDRQDLVHSELARQRIYQARWRHIHELLGDRLISRKSRRDLAARGVGGDRENRARGKAAAEALTLRILLVRISFETNRRPDLVTMSPSGDFFLEPPDPDDPLPIDPTPHDRAYFESHVQGLAEYYRFQSGGRLDIVSQVLPPGDRDSYKLGDVADYGPGDSGFWTLDGIERLVRDMIRAADAGTRQDGSADLSDFGDGQELTYIIFAHAGSDWQSDINQDSPNDIPTFFVTLGEPEPLLGGGMLSECSVIPETTNQDGYRGSIAAALYHEFGHALGLPDVYDATTGLTSCGVWDLMDSGTNLAAVIGYEWPPDSGQIVAEAVAGILPPSLSAWCRWWLGWLDDALIGGGDGDTHALPAVGVPREHYALHNTVPGNAFSLESPQVLRGGVSPREFFLVENRWVPRTVLDTPYDPYDAVRDWGGLYFKRDPATGVVLYLAGDRDGQAGWNTGYYDYFLPDGGLLVWHVNMDRIEAGLEDNSVNRFGDGLRLVEADGIQDIGVLDAYVLGWSGSARDPFAPWNTAGYNALFVQGAGLPTSRTHDRSWTGLRLWDIADGGQAYGAVMTLRAAVQPILAGWPRELPPGGTLAEPQARALDVASLTPLRYGTKHLLAAFTAAQAGQPVLLMLWSSCAEPAYAAPAGLPAGAVAQLATEPVGPPAEVVLPDGSSALVFGTADGWVHAYGPQASWLAHLWSRQVGEVLLAGPQPVSLPGGDWLLLAIDGDGRGHLLDAAGTRAGEPQLLLDLAPEPVVPLRVVSLQETAAVLIGGDAGWRLQPVTAAGFASGATAWSGRLDGPAQIAVVADEGAQRLLIFGPDGLQGAWRIDGAGDWTVSAWPDPGSALVCEPAVADLDGDGRLDVVAATAERLFAWHADGAPLAGFPLALASLFPLPRDVRIAGPLVVADLAGGPANEVAFATDRGHLFVVRGDGRLLESTPFRFGDGGGAGLLVAPLAGDRSSLVLASAGGLVGPPLERQLTHGRLALYGDRPLPATGPATAGWFGRAGGGARTGTVGVARAVAGDGDAPDDREGVVYFPNPLRGRELTVRFWSATAHAADLAIYNLQGEVVHAARLEAAGERLNEHTVELDVASGLYVARLTWQRAAGALTSQVRTVAVAR